MQVAQATPSAFSFVDPSLLALSLHRSIALQYGTTYDLSCSYGCCEPCTTSCPAGQKLVPVCSFESDNLCVDAGSYSALAAAVKAKTNGGRLLLAADGELAAEGSAEINAEHSTEDLTLIARIARALGLSA